MFAKKAFKFLSYTIILCRIAGFKSFAGEIARRIYSIAHFIRLELDMVRALPKISSSIDFYLEAASPDDIQNLLEIAGNSSSSSAYDLVARKFFYDSGFHDCYVGKTKADKELCYLGWLLSAKKYPELQHGFKGIPPLKEDEVLLYNLFVFDRYRGKGVASSADAQLCEIARKNGFKHAIVYPLKSNPAAIKALKKIGFTERGTKTHVYFAFFVKRTSKALE
jgi:ribosomal protein S18 acetylase RimI-like enzyme